MTRAATLAVILTSLLLATAAQAARFESFGDYQVHYNAFPSGMLDPEMARRNGIQRSRVRGVVLISVMENGISVPATIRIKAVDSQRRDRPVEMRQRRSDGAVTYIGTFPIKNGETLRFRLEVHPSGVNQPFHIAFSQQFFD